MLSSLPPPTTDQHDQLQHTTIMIDNAASMPPPSPQPSLSASPTLSDQINIATRSTHTTLNKLILARLPLALPPYTTNPSTYISGLLYIAPIYITFESLWQSILDAPQSSASTQGEYDSSDPNRPLLRAEHVPASPNEDKLLASSLGSSPRIKSILVQLQLPGLLRSKRLKADICILSGLAEQTIEHQLHEVAKQGRLAEFIAHTKRAVESNPHVLLAYAWVLYMALFSGGRYLRAALQGAGGLGGDFWGRDPSPVRPYTITGLGSDTMGRRTSKTEASSSTYSREEYSKHSGRRDKDVSKASTTKVCPGMQFFNFSGDEDGEDIKREFKLRIKEAENLLSDIEKDEIITEAQVIFEYMVKLVAELDEAVGTSNDDLESERLHRSFRSKMSSRDSLEVNQKRLSKRQRTGSETLEDLTVEKQAHFGNLILDPLSLLIDALPSLSAVSKSGRKVTFHSNTKHHSNQVAISQTTALKTAISAFVAGIALLMAWWFIV